jgi:hypothetical protein
MPFLNLNYGLLIFEDQTDRNPKIKLPDLGISVEGVVVDHEKSDRLTVFPNETKDIAATERAVQWDSSTELQTVRYLASGDNVRLKWTGNGTNPVFRTKRAIGGSATTTVTISRVTPYVARITNVSGTAWTLASVAVNDFIKFERNTDSFTSPFSAANLGKTFLVQAKGANYIDFVDNGSISLDASVLLGPDYDTALRVMSQGPVKIGDTIEISGAGFNPSNIGRFTIVDVSPDYLEIINPLGTDETVVYGSNSLIVYEYLIGFVHLRASGRFKLKFSNQTDWFQVDRLGKEVIFLGSVQTHRIQALNDGVDPVTISIQYATLI